MSNARPALLEGSAVRSAGTATLRAGTPVKSLPIPGTTMLDRENLARDPDNILVHAGERTQSLYEVWPTPFVQRIRPSPRVQFCVPQRFARIDIPDPGDARLIQQKLLQGTFRSSQARMKFLCSESIRKRIHSQLFAAWAAFFGLPPLPPP